MSRIDTLTKTFHAYSAAFCTDPAAENLNAGGKVLLPQSFLQDVTRASLVYPLQMLIQTRYRKFVYCGVLSFVAAEGQVIMPYWMLRHLQIDEGTVVQLQTCSLPKASIIKLRPHEKLFTELSNPRAVLEASLKNHTCLTKGTTIEVRHVDNTFAIDVLDIKGARGTDERAVLVVDSDVKVEFERPLDMPPSPPRSPVQMPFNVANGIIGGGGGSASNVIGSSTGGGGGFAFGSGAGYKPPTAGPSSGAATAAVSEPPKMPTLEPKFSAFKGTGRNLKGEVVTNGSSPVGGSSSSTPTPTPTSATPTPSPAPSATPTGGRTLGSGSGAAPSANHAFLAALQRRMDANINNKSNTNASAATPSPAPSSSAAAESPSAEGGAAPGGGFVPFGGTGRRLKD